MSVPYEDAWAGSALKDLALLPPHARDQVEALVRQICRDPYGNGTSRHEGADARNRVARTGQSAVFYQVSAASEMIRIASVGWFG